MRVIGVSVARRTALGGDLEAGLGFRHKVFPNFSRLEVSFKGSLLFSVRIFRIQIRKC